MRTRSCNHTSAGDGAIDDPSNAKGKKKNANPKKPASTPAARVTKKKAPTKTTKKKAPAKTTKSPAPSVAASTRSRVPKSNGPSTRTSQIQHVAEHSEDDRMADSEDDSDSNSGSEEDSEIKDEEDQEDTRVAQAPIADNRARYGCTCGRCIDGFLSPRMAFALERQGEINSDSLDMEISLHRSPGSLSAWEDDLLKDVPVEAKYAMRTHKSPWKGFGRLFGHVAECLRRGILPTTENVLPFAEAEWPRESRCFLDRGGTVASVVLACFEGVFDQSVELGDGTHEATYRRNIARMPACRNDTQYKMARKGYNHFEGFESKKWWRDMEFRRRMMSRA